MGWQIMMNSCKSFFYCIILCLSVGNVLFSAENAEKAMVPSVSEEYYILFDRLLQLQYGIMPKNKSREVIDGFKKLAEQGDILAAAIYADFENDHSIYQTIFPKMLVLARQGNTLACLRLCSAYRFGYGVEKNPEQAEFWRKKYRQLRLSALAQDDPVTMWEEIFLISLDGGDKKEIPELLKKLEKYGSVTAAFLLKQFNSAK